MNTVLVFNYLYSTQHEKTTQYHFEFEGNEILGTRELQAYMFQISNIWWIDFINKCQREHANSLTSK